VTRTFEKINGFIAPAGIAINISTNKAYVSDYASNTVFVIDLKTNSVIHRIKVGTNPVGISVNPISNRIYVTNIGDNTVSVIDGSNYKILFNNSSRTRTPFIEPPFDDNGSSTNTC